jgi:hypothetical protein
MSVTRVNKFAIQMAAASALVVLSAGIASAQKSKGGGPPVTTHGETRANDAAAKGQANAESKRNDGADDKAARAADKKEDAAERTMFKSARSQPKELLKGIKLTSDERKSVEGIEKKYDGQIKDLEKQEDAAEKAGKPDTTIASKIAALRTQERADLRGVLTPDQATQFDKNAAAIDSKH